MREARFQKLRKVLRGELFAQFWGVGDPAEELIEVRLKPGPIVSTIHMTCREGKEGLLTGILLSPQIV